ncbi:MAG: hypothetical protein AMXMBFR84_15560 [Candidatus Hydrogenedentota bacterium]
MQTRIALLSVLLMSSLFWGCEGSYRFTSAELQGGSRGFFDALDYLAGGGAEATNDAGGPPESIREVVEPDVIRQEDDILYVLNQHRGLTTVDLTDKRILDQTPTFGYPRDLYINGNRAFVLVSYASKYTVNGDTVEYDIASRLYVVNIADPENMSIVSSFDFEGDLSDSRMVGSVIYAVTADYEWYWAEGQAVKTKTSASRVTSINVANESNIFEADEVGLAGIGDVVQASPTAIYVAQHNWQSDTTSIAYVDISKPNGAMTVRGAVTVAGYVADKFKMDEYMGVLRVVSNAWSEQRRVYVTTVDLADPDNLTVLAELEFERARGDSLFATRFDGPLAYVVTYFVVDPLFVVDLSDPSNPAVAGELEVPGWSTHIEPRGDKLIALGVDDTNGRRVSVSLFDISDPSNPTLADKVSFGQNWSWSSAYDDVKAFTVLDDLLIVPFSGWEEIGGGFDRLQFISWAPTDLALRGTIDLQGSVLRSFEWNSELFGLTTEQLATVDGTDLDNPTVANSLVLAENVTDFLELSNSLGVELITQFDTGKTIARATGLPLKAAVGSVQIAIGELFGSHVYGDNVVLVGTSWNDDAGYKVAKVNFTDPSHPVVSGPVNVNVWPHYGYWWILPYDMAAAAQGSGADVSSSIASDAIYGPWWPSHMQPSTFVTGNSLVLRCSAGQYNSVIGNAPPAEGLALVNLDTLVWTGTVGLGVPAVVSIDQNANKLYISSKEYVLPSSPLIYAPPLCAYFVTEFDPSTGQAGPTVNVPGTFVRYDAPNGLLTLRDDEWQNDESYRSLLRTVAWTGGTGVTEIASVFLPTGTARVVGRGSKVFIESYMNGVRIHAANVAANGSIQLGEGTLITPEWGNLIDANGNSAYVNIGGGAVARYDCAGKPALKELIEVMGSPYRIRFGGSAAYAPLGFFGIVELSL